jgi:hypothetical protein
MSAVAAVNLVIHRGTDFEEEFNLTEDNGAPLDLVGYVAAAKVRKHSSAKKYVPFVVTFIDRTLGRIKLSLTNEQTLHLKSGRNCYDLILIDASQRRKKVVEGSVIVYDTATVEILDSQNLDGLGNINIDNLGDGYVLMYNQSQNQYIFVDPDEVLSQSVKDGVLPQDFINKLDVDLDDRIDVDAGEF